MRLGGGSRRESTRPFMLPSFGENSDTEMAQNGRQSRQTGQCEHRSRLGPMGYKSRGEASPFGDARQRVQWPSRIVRVKTTPKRKEKQIPHPQGQSRVRSCAGDFPAAAEDWWTKHAMRCIARAAQASSPQICSSLDTGQAKRLLAGGVGG